MNLAAITHETTLPYRQPIARNIIHFRILTAQENCTSVTLNCWKRSDSFPESLRVMPLSIRYADGIHAEWVCDADFAEETHYIKYYFRIDFTTGETRFFCEHGFLENEPERGYFELLQANETEVTERPSWCRSIVYYQIFPERFAVGNSNKTFRDYVPWQDEPTRENFLGGDLNGIRAKLPYLRMLGVECLYLNPVFSGDFNHKYATADYFQIDLDFGTNEDLIALVDEAHAGGIRVVLDGVFNHAGVRFAPFADVLKRGASSRYRDWFYIKRFPVIIDAECYECVGDYPYMPRLRTANPETREYILSVMLYWLKTAKIDGWRLDVADELDVQTVRYLREHLKREYPDALLLGETWGDASRMVCEGDQFDCAMNYLFRDAMVDFFAKGRINAADLDHRLSHMLMKYPDATNLCQYNCLGSHDTARFLTEASGENWRLKLAIAFQILFPGSPAIYYGDELGMTGENDPGCRGGMVWDHGDVELLKWTHDLIALRKNSMAARLGDYHTLIADPVSNVFAFERQYGNERLIAIFNRGKEPHTLDFADATGTITVPSESVKIIQ